MSLSVGTAVTFNNNNNNNNAPFTVVGDKGVIVAISEGNAAPYELKMEDGRTRFASSDELDA